MPCYKPLAAWRGVRDRAIYWRKVNDSDEIRLACGQCIGCRLERSRQWAVRCMHEAQLHKHNSFLTLTLDDKHLTEPYSTGLYYDNGQPAYAGTLAPRDTQLFLKRLRKALCKKGGWDELAYNVSPSITADRPRAGQARVKPKYYLGAEYGTRYRRPHYHLCLFGVDFADKKYFRKSPAGEKLYRSQTLETLWPIGYSTIGNVTFETAAYVARYVMKKITGQAATNHYEIIDKETGEIKKLKPEYNNMSRRPGIAWDWLMKYTADVYPQGQVIVKGRQTNSPRYYDKLYAKLDPYGYDDLKLKRETEALGNYLEQTHERLAVREAVATAKTKLLKRKI